MYNAAMSMDVCKGAGVAGVRLCTIGGSAGETEESGFIARQKGSTRLFGFLFDL